jgi:hypothetical protein
MRIYNSIDIPIISEGEAVRSGLRHKEIFINRAKEGHVIAFAKSDEEKAQLATAKAEYKRVKREDSAKHKADGDSLINEILKCGVPKYGGLKIANIRI